MRAPTVALCIFLSLSPPLMAQVNIGIGLPGVSIGIDLGTYPELIPIPDYPVYYAPNTDANLFFFDGLYWAYSRDGWYSSAWYNGPWDALSIEEVPLFLLRVPVRYYRQAPVYFRGWRADAPPRWGERFGPAWEGRHRDWDHWDRDHAPRLAPLPVYQRDYDRVRYPQSDQQRELREHHYPYVPQATETRHAEPRNAPAAQRPRAEPPAMRDQPAHSTPRAVEPRKPKAHAIDHPATPAHDPPPRKLIKRERDIPAQPASDRRPSRAALPVARAPRVEAAPKRDRAQPAAAREARGKRQDSKDRKDGQDDGRAQH